MTSNTSLLLKCAAGTTQVVQATTFLAKKYALTENGLLKNPDLHWLNPDTDPEEFKPLSIEQVRDMTAEMVMRPFQGVGELKQAIFVICKIELASIPAQNALLKSLEEPPAHVQFILTSNNPQKVLPTILSRCKLIELATSNEPLADRQITVNLSKIFHSSYTDLMDLSSKYKEKPDAISFLTEMLTTLHQDNMQQPTSQKTKLIQENMLALDYLSKNVNTRLVLENFLFQFKTS